MLRKESVADFKKIEESLAQRFGKELVTTLSRSLRTRVSGIDWGIPRLNMICTADPTIGLVYGRMYELFGPPSSGKTTLCLHAIASAQRVGEPCGYIDVEHAIDLNYAKALGIKIDKLFFSQPDFGEEAISVLRGMIMDGVRLIVVDSVAALTPRAELEAENDKFQIGAQARLMSAAMRKVTSIVGKYEAIVLWINQTRNKIGVMFGSPEITSGGDALKFYASVRLRISLSQAKNKIKDSGAYSLVSPDEAQKLGSIMVVENKKNKIAPPFEKGEFSLNYGFGVDSVLDTYELAVNLKLINVIKGGIYILPDGTKIKNTELESGLPIVKDLIIGWNSDRIKAINQEKENEGTEKTSNTETEKKTKRKYTKRKKKQ